MVDVLLHLLNVDQYYNVQLIHLDVKMDLVLLTKTYVHKTTNVKKTNHICVKMVPVLLTIVNV